MKQGEIFCGEAPYGFEMFDVYWTSSDHLVWVRGKDEKEEARSNYEACKATDPVNALKMAELMLRAHFAPKK